MVTRQLQVRPGSTRPDTRSSDDRAGATDISVRSFFLLTFVLGWGVGILMTVFSTQVEAAFGEIGYTNPVFVLAVYSPALAALILVGRRHGMRGIGQLLRRFKLWRMPAYWWVFLVVVPVVFYAGAAIAGTLGEPFPYSPWSGVVPALALTLAIGPVEELGWRGLGLPLLQRRFAPLWSSLILGAVWGVWHIPAFYLSGTEQAAWDLGPFLLGVIALSVIVTPMFNASRGSLLVPALFHFQMNGPIWPDAQPWDMYLFVAVAVIVVLLNRRSMLTREGAATDVLAPDRP